MRLSLYKGVLCPFQSKTPTVSMVRKFTQGEEDLVSVFVPSFSCVLLTRDLLYSSGRMPTI